MNTMTPTETFEKNLNELCHLTYKDRSKCGPFVSDGKRHHADVKWEQDN